MASNNHLYDIYRQEIESEDPVRQEKALEDAEEAYYMDGKIDATQYQLLIRLYANLTGDHDIIASVGS